MIRESFSFLMPMFSADAEHRYERISEMTGLAMPSFKEMYPKEVLALKTSLLKYMQLLRAKEPRGEGQIGVVVDAALATTVTLTFTSVGFPVLPRPLDTGSWKKKNWELLFMEYMGCHYSELAL